MRKRITQQNTFTSFSLETEYQKLNELFSKSIAFGRIIGPVASNACPSLSYLDCLHGLFLDWNLRGTFIKVEEMLQSLQISEEDFQYKATEDRLLDYIQFILNAVVFVDTSVKSHKYSLYKATDAIYKAIVDNSSQVVNYLGAKIMADKKELVVVYKDDVATAISEQNQDLQVSITEYLKIDNRGDIQRKGEILCTLAKKLEAFEKELNGTEFKQLCTDTTFLLNNIGARHYPDPENRIKAQFTTMKKEEVEQWYDRAFQMFLACMAAVPYLGYKDKIKALKSV